MAKKTELARLIKQGEMSMEDFFAHLAYPTAYRTHCMLGKNTKNYVLSQHPLDNSRISVDEVTELDSPEKGDFTTRRGATGPISGNVFISVNPNRFPTYMLIEGDNVELGNGSVYDSVRRYYDALIKKSA
jgi:hypothetical protein